MTTPSERYDSIETHPLEPFIPDGARLLMLGSFPPPRQRWSMEFYYPNLQNDMWRIFGVVFFGDKDYFLENAFPGNTFPGKADKPKRAFSQQRIEEFLTDRKIALSDTAHMVVRQKGNASDKFLEIVESVDLRVLMRRMPDCRAIVTTGDKATATLSSLTGAPEPPVGGCVEFEYDGRSMTHYRMPSSSRAYPLPLDRKAEEYRGMFLREKIL